MPLAALANSDPGADKADPIPSVGADRRGISHQERAARHSNPPSRLTGQREGHQTRTLFASRQRNQAGSGGWTNEQVDAAHAG
jgi:hypothetical protein